MMNILFISKNSTYTKTRYGGAEFSIRLIAEELAKLGHNINYITFDINRGFWPTHKKTLINDVEIFMLRKLRVPSRFSRIRFISGLIYRVNKYIRKTSISIIVRKKDIQVVYCLYELELLQLLLDIQNNHFKIIMRMAGMHWYEKCLKDPSQIIKWEDTFNKIDAVNYVSAGQKQMVEDKFQELNMKVSFRNIIFADIGTILANSGGVYHKKKKSKIFKVIMASRFSNYQKRQDIIVRAIALLNPEISINVKLIGSGPQVSSIRKLIKQMNAEDRITIIPFLKQNDLWQELANADLLCHACDYEGTSKIILESMALGLPVLASNVAPVNDYIIEGYNGLLVDNDPVLWAKKIEEVINNETLRLRVSKNSRKYIAKHHNPAEKARFYEKEFCMIKNTSGSLDK